MLQKISSLFLLCLFATNVFSQATDTIAKPVPTAPAPAPVPVAVQSTSNGSSSGSKLHFGMKVQPALNWFKTDTKGIENNGSEFRFNYGFVTEFRFAERYSFATGIDVTNRGGSLRQESSDSNSTSITDSNWKLRYVELPMSLKLKTNEIGHFTYYLQFGLSPGINIRSVADISTTTQLNGGGSQTSSEDGVDYKDETNAFNLSMLIGLGMEYRFSGNTCLLGGLTYSNGFLDAASDNDITLNTNYIGLTIGVLF